MPRYRLAEPACINSQLVPAGTEIEFDGPPGRAFIALDAEGAARKAVYEEELRNRKAASFRLVVERYMRDMPQDMLAGIREILREELVQAAKAKAKARADKALTDVA